MFLHDCFYRCCEFAPRPLSIHRDRRGSLHQLTKMDFRLLLLSVPLHSAACSVMYCQIRQNIEENTASGDTLSENTCSRIEEHQKGKKTGETGKGSTFQKLPQIAFSGGKGAIQAVISSLEKNKAILRKRKGAYGKPASSGWLEAQGAVGRKQRSSHRSPVIPTNHTCMGGGLWHVAGSTTCQGQAGSPA